MAARTVHAAGHRHSGALSCSVPHAVSSRRALTRTGFDVNEPSFMKWDFSHRLFLYLSFQGYSRHPADHAFDASDRPGLQGGFSAKSHGDSLSLTHGLKGSHGMEHGAPISTWNFKNARWNVCRELGIYGCSHLTYA